MQDSYTLFLVSTQLGSDFWASEVFTFRCAFWEEVHWGVLPTLSTFILEPHFIKAPLAKLTVAAVLAHRFLVILPHSM